IIAFTDDDVSPAPDWVANVTAVMRETDADIVSGRILPRWEHPPPPWLVGRPFLHGAYAIMEHAEPGEVVAFRKLPRVWGANMAFRRGVFAPAGGFARERGVRGGDVYGGARIGGWVWAAARRRPDSFDRWLASCEVMGGLWGRWKRRARRERR